MRKILVVGLVIAGLSLLAGLAIPVLAHGPGDGEAPPADQEAWEAMHEACETGDWEAMAEAAKRVHGEDFGYMHGYGYYAPEAGNSGSTPHWGGMGGHMGGGMWGRGWGG